MIALPVVDANDTEVVDDIVVKSPVDFTVPPIAVPSIAPPFISAVSHVIVVNVPAAAVFAPIVVLSIAPPFISAVVATKSVIVVLPSEPIKIK